MKSLIADFPNSDETTYSHLAVDNANPLEPYRDISTVNNSLSQTGDA